MNIANRVKEIRVEPLAGDEINELKEAVKEMAKLFKCKITFCHNADEFICDADGRGLILGNGQKINSRLLFYN